VQDLLRSVWDDPRPPDPPTGVWRDWALVGVPVPTAVLEGFLRPEMPYRIIAVVSVAGLLPTLLWRRIRPLLMIAIAFVTAGLLLPLTTGGDPPETYTSAAFLILIYALCRWGPAARS
jgi:hypothetical protein